MLSQLQVFLCDAFDANEAGNLDDTRTAIQGALEIAIKLALAQEIQAGLKRDMVGSIPTKVRNATWARTARSPGTMSARFAARLHATAPEKTPERREQPR